MPIQRKFLSYDSQNKQQLLPPDSINRWTVVADRDCFLCEIRTEFYMKYSQKPVSES